MCTNCTKLFQIKKSGWVKNFASFSFFFEKGRRIGQCTSDGGQHPLSSPLFLKPGLHVRRKHKHKPKHKHKKPTCKPVRRKHKHKRKERKVRNSDKLSAYNLVTHAWPFSAMLESNLAPKGRLRLIGLLLRLRMSRYAYAYRTCKHPCACAYSYPCVVRVNQA